MPPPHYNQGTQLLQFGEHILQNWLYNFRYSRISHTTSFACLFGPQHILCTSFNNTKTWFNCTCFLIEQQTELDGTKKFSILEMNCYFCSGLQFHKMSVYCKTISICAISSINQNFHDKAYLLLFLMHS